MSHGGWIPPGSEKSLAMPTSSDVNDNFFQFQGVQRVILHQSNEADQLSGIYRCDIANKDVHDDNDMSVRESANVVPGGIILTTTSIIYYSHVSRFCILE